MPVQQGKVVLGTGDIARTECWSHSTSQAASLALCVFQGKPASCISQFHLLEVYLAKNGRLPTGNKAKGSKNIKGV